MGILRLLYKEHAQGTCTGNMRKEARSEETVPQSEYQTDPARLMLPNALLIEDDSELGFVLCVRRVLKRAFKARSAKVRTLPKSIIHSAYSQYFSSIFQGKSASRMRSCQRFMDYNWHIGREEYESKK